MHRAVQIVAARIVKSRPVEVCGAKVRREIRRKDAFEILGQIGAAVGCVNRDDFVFGEGAVEDRDFVEETVEGAVAWNRRAAKAEREQFFRDRGGEKNAAGSGAARFVEKSLLFSVEIDIIVIGADDEGDVMPGLIREELFAAS
ncbi:MAG: hypothetical protein RIF32_15050 [Leptospirales bacterium]